jgi:glycerol-3-phosphate acyltransferase PlsY
MAPLALTVVVAVLAYLLGCLDAGYYLVRYRTGGDIREQGSGGTGAKNAGRVLGRNGFIIVFLLDFLKAVAALWLASALGTGRTGMAVAAIAVVIGHIAPVQLRFRGGKGGSSALGALLVLTPAVALTSLLVSAAFFLISRKGTASGVATFAFMPAFALAWGAPTSDILAVTAVTAILLVTHRIHFPEIASFFRRTNPVIRETAR